MGLVGILARTVGQAVRVPVKDGIMLPYIYKYADKIADLRHEKLKVSESYLRDLIQEAYQKSDFEGLKVIYKYMVQHNFSQEIVRQIMDYGIWMKIQRMVGNPFALVESVVRHLC